MSDPSPIDRLMAELRAELSSRSWRSRRALLAEARAHLEDAADDEQAAGLDRPAAEQRACDRFGSAVEYGRLVRADARSPRRGLVVGLGGAAVGVVAAATAAIVIGTGGSGGHRSAPATPAAPVVPVAGGTAMERALARRVVSGFGRSAIVAVRFGGPPTVDRRPHGTWLYVTVSAGGLRTSQAAEWEGRLVEGGYRNLAHLAGLSDLTGVGFSIRLPDGSTRGAGAGLPGGNPPSRVVRGATRTAISFRVRTAARRAGLALRSLTLLHPYQYAPMIVLEARSPSGFAHRLLDFQAHLHLTGTAGSMIEIQAPSGRTVYAETSANQTGASSLYADPHWYTSPFGWGTKQMGSLRTAAGGVQTLR